MKIKHLSSTNISNKARNEKSLNQGHLSSGANMFHWRGYERGHGIFPPLYIFKMP